MEAYHHECDFFGIDPDKTFMDNATRLTNIGLALICEGLLAYWLTVTADKAKQKRMLNKELASARREGVTDLVFGALLERAESMGKFGLGSRAKSSGADADNAPGPTAT